jgi:EGF-like domain.
MWDCTSLSLSLYFKNTRVSLLRNMISYSNESNVFTCDCPEGYYGSSCEHFNPCSRSPCQHNSTCSNITSSKYMCLCKPGYTGESCIEAIVMYDICWKKEDLNYLCTFPSIITVTKLRSMRGVGHVAPFKEN